MESRAVKNWCFQIVVPEKTLERHLDYKRTKSVNLKGNQPWIVIGRTNTEAETPILWPPDVNSWLIGKDPDAGKDGRQKEKRVTEDEMVGWYHWLSGHEFEQTLGDSERQRSLVSCSPWGCKVGVGVPEAGVHCMTLGIGFLFVIFLLRYLSSSDIWLFWPMYSYSHGGTGYLAWWYL